MEAALGKRPFDLVIKNVKILNCFTSEIYPGEIGIYGGFISHINSDPDNVSEVVDKMESKVVFNGKGMFIIPGFIDPQMHIESSMMTPRNFAKAVIPLGTTTLVTDPHEVANVMGLEAVEYMLKSSDDLPMRQFILAPSCVPPLPGLESSGACFTEKEISEILNWERVVGLGEVMDCVGVISNSQRITSILDTAIKKDAFLQGHAPKFTGRNLSAYLCGGPNSDHEVTIGQEAREKLRLGMHVDARESSISWNVEEIVSSIKDFPVVPPNLTLCTDDREPEDILKQGHMNYVVRKAIESGINPIETVKCATINVAKEIGIENLGAIAPGFVADLVLVSSLEELKAAAVFFQGKLVAQDEILVAEVPIKEFSVEKINTIDIKFPLNVDIFKIEAPIHSGNILSRVISYPSLNSNITEFTIEDLPVNNGFLDIRFKVCCNY